ncbi:phosphoglycolate phosphatase [Halosegnis rubeus]|jgi:phosphoglycolate phosphatase (TIGR01487 family)|uniref:Phosphoglycolate phosphatase n=1 Tax=Halosegnis rubeus TaxID=2212850 RepID=A0A5N5UAR4_9EURY|nr:phosphoglycolate phosphatase [Halosegnis rubeus]KAB7515706.1 phosphoglycolate phosphatase [Halosegnis rubeus]KAB7517079.1 phosphoglycolate phosphatase [Halosegnis rubeus]
MRPLAVDIDGTLTRTHDDVGLDPRVFDALRAYHDHAPVVIATGKAFPFPTALCRYLNLPNRVIAENGGVTLCESAGITHNGDPEAARAVADAYRAAGYDLGWGTPDLTNYWRETEVAVALEQPFEPLQSLATEHGLEVVDTGYAYHVKAPDVDKGTGLETIAADLGYEPSEFLAIGDSENDAELFDIAGESYAVANADDTARAAADTVTEAGFADGFLEALDEASVDAAP